MSNIDIETSSPPSPPNRTDRIDGILNSPPESPAMADDEKSPTSAMTASTARRVRRRGTIELPKADGTKVRSFGRRHLSRRLTVEDTGIGGGAKCPFTELQRAKRRASYRADDDAEVEKDSDETSPASSSHAGPRFVPPKTRHDSTPSSRPRFVPSTTPNEMSPSKPSSSITGRPVFVPPRETDHDEVRNDQIFRLFDDARRQLPSSDDDRGRGGNQNGMPRFVPPVNDYHDGFVRPMFVPPVDPYDDAAADNEDEGSGTFHPRPRLVPPVGDDDGEDMNLRICKTLREGNIASKMPRTVHVKRAGAYIPSGFSRPKFRPCRMHLQDDDDGEVSSVAAVIVKDPASDRSSLPDYSEDSRRRVARGTIEVPAEMRKPVGLPVFDGPAKEARRPRRRRGTIEIPDSVRRPVGSPVVDVVEKPSKMRIKLERSTQPVYSYDSDACVGVDANEATVKEVGGGAEDPDEPESSLSRRLEARLATARRIRGKLGDKGKTRRKRRVTIEGPCPLTALQVEKQQSREGRRNSRRPKRHKTTRRPARTRRATDEWNVPSAEGGKGYDFTVQPQSTPLAGELSELRDLRSSPTAELYPVGTPVEDSTLDWTDCASDSRRSGSTGTVVSLTLDRIAEIKARFDRRRAKSEQRGSRLDQSVESSSTASISVGNLLDDSTRTDASEGGRRRSTASDAEDIFEAHNSSFMCDNDCGRREDRLSKSDNPSRWSAALDRYRRDGKSTDPSASEGPTDDLPEDEVGRRGSRSKHLGQSKSGYALTEPTAAMSSSSFYLAKEEGRDAFDLVTRPTRVGSHISVRPLDESISSLETSARSSGRRSCPAGQRSGSSRSSAAGTTPDGNPGGRTPTEEQSIAAVRKKKNSRMRRRATADCVMSWDQDGMERPQGESVRSWSRVAKDAVDGHSERKANVTRRRHSVCGQ